jgi:hypothetical protein
MAPPVNLNRARKQKSRAEKPARVAENLVTFGQSKAEKLRQKAQAEKAGKMLDGHRRDP